MAAKTRWHRYRTKLRHCHPMYSPSAADTTTVKRLVLVQMNTVNTWHNTQLQMLLLFAKLILNTIITSCYRYSITCQTPHCRCSLWIRLRISTTGKSKCTLPRGIRPTFKTWSLRVHIPCGISIGWAVGGLRLWQTNRQTDTHADYATCVTAVRILCSALRYGLKLH